MDSHSDQTAEASGRGFEAGVATRRFTLTRTVNAPTHQHAGFTHITFPLGAEPME